MRFDHYFVYTMGIWYAVSLVYNDAPNPEFGDAGWYVVLENLYTGDQEWSACYFENFESVHMDFLYAIYPRLNPLI